MKAEPPSKAATKSAFSMVSVKEPEPVMPEPCKGTAVKVYVLPLLSVFLGK